MSVINRFRVSRLALLALTLLVLSPAPGNAQALERAEGVYAEKTGHSLRESFWGYWVTHDGPALLGLPISEPIEEGDEHVQYFEYGALTTKEDKIERVEAGVLLNDLLGDPAGVALQSEAEQNGTPVPEASPVAAGAKLPRAIQRAIDQYVEKRGGRNRFGKALGTPEIDDHLVLQWFTYGRIKVEIGPKPVAHQTKIGSELARALEIDIAPVPNEDLPLLDLKRPGANYFVGDGTIPEAAGAFDPVGILIPSVGIDGAIEQIGIIDGTMGVPEDPWNVGWYHQLSAPGLTGNAVMAGHVDWWGIGPTIFYNLSSIQVGAMIYVIDADGEGATYEVSSVGSVTADTNAGEVVAATEAPSLTLITCTGTFNGIEYTSRLIVKAVRI